MKAINVFFLIFLGTQLFAQQEIILNEEFNNNKNGWNVQSKMDAKSEVRDGKYICDINRGTYLMDQLINVNLDSKRDFVIESILTKKRGNASFGISWGADGKGSRYNFMIFSKGTYTIQKWINYDVFSYVTDTPTYAVRPDFSPNKLTVKKEGNMIMFYINDAFLQELPFEPFFGSKIGFYSNSGDLLLEVENLKVYYTSGSRKNVGHQQKERISLFVETFSDNSRKWYEVNKKDFFCKVKNGKYIIDYKGSEASYNLYNLVFLDPEKDYIIETSIVKVEGSKENGFGLTFGYKDPANKNDFIISSNGQYKITKWNKNKATDLIGWTNTASIKKGNGVENKLSIQKEGKFLKFLINDVYVDQIPIPAYYGERIGFVVYKNQHIEITDLQIYYLGISAN